MNLKNTLKSISIMALAFFLLALANPAKHQNLESLGAEAGDFDVYVSATNKDSNTVAFKCVYDKDYNIAEVLVRKSKNEKWQTLEFKSEDDGAIVKFTMDGVKYIMKYDDSGVDFNLIKEADQIVVDTYESE